MTTTLTPPPPVTPDKAPKADLSKEYVSGAGYTWYAAYLRALPQYIDDVSRDFGIDLYRRMLYDPQVASAVNTLKHQILARPLRLTPPVGKTDARYKKAAEICAHVQRTLDGMATPLLDVLWGLLDALCFGHKVAEKVYRVQQGGPDAGCMVLDRVKVRPLESTAFVLDPYSNVVGLLALMPGVGWPVQAGTLIADPKMLPNFLPREKFAVLTLRSQDGDPRGQSLLRPAYNGWWLKQQLWGEYLKFLSQFASPLLWGATPENAQPQVIKDATGAVLINPATDAPFLITPEESMVGTLTQVRNGAAVSFPFGSEVHAIQMAGEGEAFLSAFELFNREIEKGITGQTLATSEGQHQARAAASVHQDVLGGVATYGRTVTEIMLYRDVCRPQVVMNFGEELADLTPRPMLSDTEAQDQAGLWTAAASLHTAHYFAPSQYSALDAQLGLPEREEDEIPTKEELMPAPPVMTAPPGDQGAGSDDVPQSDKPSDKASSD